MRRVLIVGWPSFTEGVATAGDVLSMETAARALEAADVPHDVAWSPVFRPGGLSLASADPHRYTHLLFVCGPLHGPEIAELHRRYATCRRIAAGVSVIDARSPAAAGFDVILARDGDRTAPPERDLSAASPRRRQVPVVGVILAPAQPEYGSRGAHDRLTSRLLEWLRTRDCAPVPVDTRLDHREWRLCATTDQFESVLTRMDLIVTTRLHGLVLALRNGVPALAVDPVTGGAKVAAQAHAWAWPAALSEPFGPRDLDAQWDWCLSSEGVAAARTRAEAPAPTALDAVLRELG